jgi:hypothetical protein
MTLLDALSGERPSSPTLNPAQLQKAAGFRNTIGGKADIAQTHGNVCI